MLAEMTGTYRTYMDPVSMPPFFSKENLSLVFWPLGNATKLVHNNILLLFTRLATCLDPDRARSVTIHSQLGLISKTKILSWAKTIQLVKYSRGSNSDHSNSESIRKPYILKVWFRMFGFRMVLNKMAAILFRFRMVFSFRMVWTKWPPFCSVFEWAGPFQNRTFG